MLKSPPLLLWACLFCAPAVPADQGANLLRAHFIDVGQGDAIWLQGPAGEGSDSGLNILIDGGPDTGNSNRLIKYLEKYGLKKGSLIDYMISTHPHNDHYPGLLDILKHYEVKTIIDPGFPKKGKEFEKFISAVKEEKANGKKSSFVELRKKKDFKLDWGDLEARILHADSEDLKQMGSGNTRENNASTVVRVVYGSFSFLFMGDAEGKERHQPPETLRFVEKLLIDKMKDQLPSTVIKAGHHGSETGSTLEFIRAVQPEVVVVMSGRKKFSGTFLPDAAVLARYKKERPGATIVRTDFRDEEEGHDTTSDADGDDILIYTDGDSLRVYQSRRTAANKRRWTRIRTIQP